MGFFSSLLENCCLNWKPTVLVPNQPKTHTRTHAPSVFTKTVMSYQGCLVNGSREHQAWRHVVMPSAPALHYQLAVMCKHPHTLLTQAQRWWKESRTLKSLSKLYSFLVLSKGQWKMLEFLHFLGSWHVAKCCWLLTHKMLLLWKCSCC